MASVAIIIHGSASKCGLCASNESDIPVTAQERHSDPVDTSHVQHSAQSTKDACPRHTSSPNCERRAHSCRTSHSFLEVGLQELLPVCTQSVRHSYSQRTPRERGTGGVASALYGTLDCRVRGKHASHPKRRLASLPHCEQTQQARPYAAMNATACYQTMWPQSSPETKRTYSLHPEMGLSNDDCRRTSDHVEASTKHRTCVPRKSQNDTLQASSCDG